MSVKEIFEKLKKEFAEEVFDVSESDLFPFALVSSSKIKEIASFFKKESFMHLSAITGIDEPPDFIFLIYHFYSLDKGLLLHIKVKLERNNPEAESISDIYSTANWHERECYDLLGVKFRNHPDLRRILMPEDWVGHPLRKDYKQIEEYHGIKTD